jgi:hypothetical protein
VVFIARNLVLDSVRSFDCKRPFSKIVPFVSARPLETGGIAEIQSAVQMNAMVKHRREMMGRMFTDTSELDAKSKALPRGEYVATTLWV